MKVLALRADAGGCAHYRIEEPARVVGEQFDIDVEVRTYVDVDGEVDENGLTTVTEIREQPDVLVVQRPLKQAFVSLIAQAQKQGIAVVVEVDDHFGAVHPRNTAHRAVQPETSPLENYKWLEQSAALADLVTTSTPVLADHYGQHGRAAVLRNYVPESVLDLPVRSRLKPVIGWTGTTRTHPEDLPVVGDGVAKALKLSEASIFVVGDSHGVGSDLGLPITQKVPDSGWVPLSEYLPTVAQTIDIGIVPLEDTLFNRAKSWLKGLEFAALGIPFIASPTPEYQLLNAMGIGELADSPGEWRRGIVRWAQDGRRRTSAGQRYRDKVRESLTYETNAFQWRDAWLQAVENRKNAS